MEDAPALPPNPTPADAAALTPAAGSLSVNLLSVNPLSPPAFDRRRVNRWALVCAGVLLLAYLLLQNPYWVPGGDSDFYVSIARSMARGQGFRYNGLPVAISPPGWPWVMSQVMKVSPTFLALKLVTMLSMLGSLVIGYFVALRFLRPRHAAVATMLAGLLMPVYSLTYFLHSEGLYCLLSALALLLALRLREGRGGPGHVVALLLACVTLPLVRWAGVFQLIPIAAVLMSGPRGMPLVKRHWKTAAACVLAIIATWVGTREALRLTPQEIIDVRNDGVGTSTDTEIDESQLSNSLNPTIGGEIHEKHGIVREYFDRTLRAGKWFTWTLWQPSRFASVIKPADVLVTVVGWGVIVLLGYLAVVEAMRGEWIWLSLALYTGGLCLNWDNPNSRYFVPVAPLIIVGLMLATRRLAARLPLATFDAWKWLRRGLVYSILFCNLAMYGIDVIVMRSSAFYDTFEAGQHKDLIAMARYMSSLPQQPATQPSSQPATQSAATASTQATTQSTTQSTTRSALLASTQSAAGPGTRKTAATTQGFDPYVQYRPEDGDLMINERYENLGRVRYSKAGSRAMVLLTDRYVRTVEYGKFSKQVAAPFADSFAKRLKARGVDWLMIQSPAIPWRVWHFHLPMDVYKAVVKNDDRPPSGGWTLYHFARYDRSFTPQPVAPVDNWPTRVPGM